MGFYRGKITRKYEWQSQVLKFDQCCLMVILYMHKLHYIHSSLLLFWQMYSMSPYNQIAHYCSLHKLRRSYVIMKLCIGDPARRLKLDSGRRLNGITCRRSASAQHCPFGIFYTRRPLGSEQRCLSLHRIWCPLHLLNNSMERGDISSRIITVWGWQAPLSRARWEQALHCWRELKDTATAGAAGTADDKSFS